MSPRLLTNPLLSGALGADWALMLQAEVICGRSSDGDFLLEKSGFMKNPAEGRPTVEFGWRYGGSSAGGVLRTLGKVEHWRSPEFNSVVEVRTESGSCRSSDEIRKAVDHRRNLDGVWLL